MNRYQGKIGVVAHPLFDYDLTTTQAYQEEKPLWLEYFSSATALYLQTGRFPYKIGTFETIQIEFTTNLLLLQKQWLSFDTIRKISYWDGKELSIFEKEILTVTSKVV